MAKNSRYWTQLVVLLFAAVICQPSAAQTYRWTGDSSSNDWDANTFPGTTNWNLSGLPGPSNPVVFDTVFAGGPITVALNGNRTVSQATLSGSSSIMITENTLTLTTGRLTVNQSSFPYTISSNINLGSTSALWGITGSPTALTVSGVISGNNLLTKSGTGGLRLNGANTFSGDTRISSGVIRLANSNALQNSAVTVLSGGDLLLETDATIDGLDGSGDVILNSNTLTTDGSSISFSGVISGSGGINKNGSSILTLTGNNTFTGNSQVSSGTLRIGSGGSSGTLASSVAVSSSAFLEFDRSDDYTYTRNINGTGRLIKDGAGTLTLTGVTSLPTQFSQVTEGALQIGDGGGSGTIASDLTLTGGTSLIFNRSSTRTHDDRIAGAGQVIKRGSGALTFTAPNTYSGGTLLENGVLSISLDNNLGNGASNVVGEGGTLRIAGTTGGTRNFINNNGLTFDVATNATYTVGGTVTGDFIKTGDGTLLLTGSQTGGTTISVNGGTLQIGNGGTAGSVAADLSVASEVIFDRSDSYALPNQISGAGTTTIRGGGTASLSGTLGTSGATTVESSTLELLAGGQITSSALVLDDGTLAATETGSTNLDVTLIGTGTFDVAAGQTFTFNGQFGPTGALQKTGDGTLVLNGTGTYSDGTQVTGGTLQAASTAALGTGPMNAGGGTVLIGGDANIGVAGLIGPSSLAIGPGGSFETSGGGSFEVTVGAFGEVTMTGGTIASERLKMSFGSQLSGNGDVAAAVLAAVGSEISTSGTTSLGDSSKTNGFYSAGDLHVTSGTTTLSDANDAVFDSSALVTLGDGNGGSAIIEAANGLTLDFGGNISGFGTINSNDDITTPLTNNGHIAGNSPTEKIVLSGYVKGVGTMDNVMITGTDAPGFSPATVVRGSVEYDGVLEIEIEGSQIGDFDRIEHSLGAGVVDLGGSLEVVAAADVPLDVGDALVFMTSIGGIINTFDSVTLPTLDAGRGLRLVYGETIVALEVFLQGDFNGDNVVDLADYTLWRNNLGAADESGINGSGDGMNGVDIGDYNLWKANFGNSASSLSNVSVPEPASCAMVCSSIMIGLVLLRRVRSL